MAQYTRPNLSVDSQRNTQVIFKVLATLAETFVFIYMVGFKSRDSARVRSV